MDPINQNPGLPLNKTFGLNGKGALDGNDLDELRRTADAFEAIFVSQFLKAARSANLADDIFGSQAGDTYQSMLDDQYAKDLASSTKLGIAEALVMQLGGPAARDEDR